MRSTLFDLGGQVALVTGASKGLGRAMALGPGAGRRLARALRPRPPRPRRDPGGRAGARRAGGGLRARRARRGERARRRSRPRCRTFDHIDILVNNAGVNVRKPALELSEQEWDRVLDTNLKGYFLVAREVGAHMVARGKGKVINVSSIFGAVGMSDQLAYASSKGGVVQLTKVLAIEWAKHGVNVNAIGPTYFETPLVAALRNDPERFRSIAERTPMGRWGQPEELEGTFVYLASRASDFVTGQTVYVDGGWTAW